MLEAGSRWLERNAAFVNALNVFPVPDGDTGTNMVLTLRSTLQTARASGATEVGPLAEAMARGALLGARGNSGVILCQIVRGLARGLQGEERLTATALAHALDAASQAAYGAMSNPVEGTILTVMREAARGAREAAERGSAGGIEGVLQGAVSAAREAVAQTPTLLPVLREAGVVDAGGQGLSILLEGALSWVQGTPEPEPYPMPAGAVSSGWLERQQAESYGFCTEFVLQGPGLPVDDIRRALGRWGQSESLVGDAALLRVHIHTNTPDDILEYGRSVGSMDQISVRDMEQQHRQFLAYHQGSETGLVTGVVAVAAGPGLADVMRSLGVSAVVWGGQTMNPSTEDILNAVEAVPAASIVLLPNNKNIIPTAEQARSVTGKEIRVLPTVSAPQGIAALVSFNGEKDIQANLAAMQGALADVRWGEVTRAVRRARVKGVTVRPGEAIGLANGDLVLSRPTLEETLLELPRVLGAEEGLLTVYYGAEVSREAAEAAAARLRERYPRGEVELLSGGQPHYPYILSAE